MTNLAPSVATEDAELYRRRKTYAWISFAVATLMTTVTLVVFLMSTFVLALYLLFTIIFFVLYLVVLAIACTPWILHLSFAIKHQKTWRWGWIYYTINLVLQSIGFIVSIVIIANLVVR